MVHHTGTKVVHLARLRDDVFAPVVEDNKDTGDIVETLAGIVSESFLQELHDTHKASYKYLTSSGSLFSFTYCPEEIRKDMIGKWATNDIAESCFGGVTSHIQRYSRINISNAAAVSDMQRNKFFKRTGGDNVGLFHGLPEGTRMALVKVAMEDAPKTTEINNVLLNRQREAKRLKVEIAKEKILQKATENYIEAVYYNRMYRSDACWKTVREVSNGVKKLKTKKDKYEALKENIKI